MYTPPQHLSDENSTDFVKNRLGKVGGVEFFKCRPVQSGSNKIRATASFKDRDTATEAAEELNATTRNLLGNTKLSVERLITLKYNVPVELVGPLQSTYVYTSFTEYISEFRSYIKFWSKPACSLVDANAAIAPLGKL